MIARHYMSLCLLLILLTTGCGQSGPATAEVAGTVTYRGKPLPLGSVLFVPEDKHAQPVGATIDARGQYRLDAVPGTYQVEVQMIARLRSQPAPEGEAAGMNMPVVEWLIPEKYAHYQTSGLSATVEAGKVNQVDLLLK